MAQLSPLRYPGSKRRLVPYLLKILEHNNLAPNVLVEPFVGGGSVALHFLAHKIVDKVIISDRDPLVYSFWKVVFTNPQHLIDFVNGVDVSLESFYRYKQIAITADSRRTKLLAEACLFLNRTSFSGLLTHKAGPLGGKFQQSEYGIACRFNRDTLVRRIESMARHRRRVVVLPYDWQDTIDYALKWGRKGKQLRKLLFYFDPPFFKKANELYRFFFSEREHALLSRRVVALKHDWILSYDNAPEIRKMYSRNDYVKVNVDMPYSLNSNGNRIEQELVVTPLHLPNLGQ